MKKLMILTAVAVSLIAQSVHAQNWPAPGAGCGYGPQTQICAVQTTLQKPEVKAFLYSASIPGNTTQDAQWHARGVEMTYGVYGHSNN